MMMPDLSVFEIKQRGQAIGWSVHRLCREARVSPATVSRALNDPERHIRRGTQRALVRVLVSLERERLRHLAERHPDMIVRLVFQLRLAPAAA